MLSKTSHMANKVKDKSSTNPLIKMIEDKKRLVNAVKSVKDLSALKGIKIVSPI